MFVEDRQTKGIECSELAYARNTEFSISVNNLDWFRLKTERKLDHIFWAIKMFFIKTKHLRTDFLFGTFFNKFWIQFLDNFFSSCNICRSICSNLIFNLFHPSWNMAKWHWNNTSVRLDRVRTEFDIWTAITNDIHKHCMIKWLQNKTFFILI